jgi:hypothetical protein
MPKRKGGGSSATRRSISDQASMSAWRFQKGVALPVSRMKPRAPPATMASISAVSATRR